MVFTGDEFADGAANIQKTLGKQEVKASFFLTGNFYQNFRPEIARLRKAGHYLGAHSDRHLLYCDWDKRDSLLVSQQQFSQDLRANYEKMAKNGIPKKSAPYFLPPFELYNSTISQWTQQEGLTLVNFTPGTRSAADYTWPEMGKSYRPSQEIYQSILDYEKKDPHGLNGFILILHIGTDPRRTDKFYFHLDELIGELKEKGYHFVRINELLD